MNLFTGHDDESETESNSPPELATPKQVRLLEGYHYSKEAVRRWTKEKAEAVLRNCKREERIALARAAQAARQQDEFGPPGQPSIPERLTAAAFLEQAQGDGVDELCQAVSYTVGVLTDDELKRLAGYLIRVYRGELGESGRAA